MSPEEKRLNELMSERRRVGHVVRLSTLGLCALLTVGATTKGRIPWRSLNATGGNERRVTAEEMQHLIERGYLRRIGVYIEVTDRGNDLIRELLAFMVSFDQATAEVQA